MVPAQRQAEALLQAKLRIPDTTKEGEHDPVQYDVRFPLDQIQRLAESSQDGVFEIPHDLATGETTEDQSRRSGRLVRLERVQRFSPSAFKYVLQQIERHTFDFASQQPAFLRYGNALTDGGARQRRQTGARGGSASGQLNTGADGCPG
jgi:hypothetical protein